ncbi:MAG: DUF1501 domain-containing protein [Gemmataceae bacterium]
MFPYSRRAFLRTTASGFGYVAFAGLSTLAAERAANPLAPKTPHFKPKARRVIFLCMEGGPSHVDTFDHKPRLARDDGKPIGRGRVPSAKLLQSPWKFSRHGQSGLWISELFPEVAKRADELCLLHGMHTDIPNHPQAFQQMHTGLFQFRRPSLGAWVLYGLGTENDRLPGFVTISPPSQNGGPANYGSAFLPAIYQGTRIGSNGRPVKDAVVSNLKNPRATPAAQRAQLDLVQAMNRAALERDRVNPGVEGVIESYELAFRMQGELPDVLNLDKESAATRQLYGVGEEGTDNFARQCLMARRLVEAGVRFVEVCHGGWDQHRRLKEDHARNARAVDQPAAALLADLKARGLLNDTVVIWGGEFGRTPYAQLGDGRDHNNKGYTVWMAGGGVKGGLSYGRTDDHGYEAVEGKVHVHDWHATILHLLGFDHERLTYRHAGRDFRLTDVKGQVVKGVLA